tara:strand:+ start:81 stop:959 length:879 start_codon:yes stop_codon:yes gene_type:complete
MDFNQIRYFLALANTLNFTRAAEQCHVTQPALTQAIKRMEDELGGELIRRDGKFTELTDLGKSLRHHFEQIDRTRHLVQVTAKAVNAGEIAELNIGIMCTIGPRILAGMLDAFQVQHPMISLVLHDVTLSGIPELLLSGAVDGVFCARHNTVNNDVEYMHLFEEPMVVAFPRGHELSQLDAVPLHVISEHHYVERLYCEFRDEFMDYFKEQGLDLNVVFSSQREDWIQSLVRDGVGVSTIPKYSLLSPELDYREIVDPCLKRNVEFAFVEQKNSSPALKMLMEHVRKYNWPG